MCRVAVLLAIAVFVASCSEPSDPCPAGCSGPLNLVIDYVRVDLPRPGRDENPPTAYSGDTLHITAQVTNRGGLKLDRTARLYVSLQRQYQTLDLALGEIRAGGTVRIDTTLVLPNFAKSSITSDTVRTTLAIATDSIRVESFAGPAFLFNFESITGPVTGFRLTPNTIELSDVPPNIRYPSRQTISLLLTNRSPHVIPSGTLDFCIFDYDYCVFLGVKSVAFSALAPHETRTTPVVVELFRDRFSQSLWADLGAVSLRSCDRLNVTSCVYVPVDVQPDYESMCAVRRLAIGIALKAGTFGRNCGAGDRINADDLLSFEAAAGASYEVTSNSLNTHVLQVFSASGRPLDHIVLRAPQQKVRVTTPATGRYYIVLQGGADYTIQVDPIAP